MLSLRDANAVVLQPQPNPIGAILRPKTNDRSYARRNKLHGIVQEVGHALGQYRLMCADYRKRIDSLYLRAALLNLRGALKQRRFPRGLDFDRPEFRFGASSAAKGEQVQQQLIHEFGGVLNPVKEMLRGFLQSGGM